MSQTLPEAKPLDRESDQARPRLIDHFKRAYQIIVGLAITQACLKVFPQGLFEAPDVDFWQFCIFFVTIVPIFHGGDRSLDIKYFDHRPVGWERAAYVWDVYMLLITAIFFVKIAQAIPASGPAAASTVMIGGVTLTSPAMPQHFYEWMAGMLIFDIFVLLIDKLKSQHLRPQNAQKLGSYGWWVAINLALAVACTFAAYPPSRLAALSAETVSVGVFMFALLRTVLDYWFGRKFLFP